MRRCRGFTFIELVIALVVGGILIGISIREVGQVQRRMSVTQGMRAFQSLHARARAHAIERGTLVALFLDTAGDSAFIWDAGGAFETLRFQEFGVDVSANPAVVRVCFTPRGYADPDCNSYGAGTVLSFAQGTNTRTLELLPMGQLIQ
ncbi:MAG: type II secretion system protein [Longimicrobiales bacterium]|nr:type II secretion system protein [Longimicrobiales bacterium]